MVQRSHIRGAYNQSYRRTCVPRDPRRGRELDSEDKESVRNLNRIFLFLGAAFLLTPFLLWFNSRDQKPLISVKSEIERIAHSNGNNILEPPEVAQMLSEMGYNSPLPQSSSINLKVIKYGPLSVQSPNRYGRIDIEVPLQKAQEYTNRHNSRLPRPRNNLRGK